jgi:hypothetical protein
MPQVPIVTHFGFVVCYKSVSCQNTRYGYENINLKSNDVNKLSFESNIMYESNKACDSINDTYNEHVNSFKQYHTVSLISTVSVIQLMLLQTDRWVVHVKHITHHLQIAKPLCL